MLFCFYERLPTKRNSDFPFFFLKVNRIQLSVSHCATEVAPTPTVSGPAQPPPPWGPHSASSYHSSELGAPGLHLHLFCEQEGSSSNLFFALCHFGLLYLLYFRGAETLYSPWRDAFSGVLSPLAHDAESRRVSMHLFLLQAERGVRCGPPSLARHPHRQAAFLPPSWPPSSPRARETQGFASGGLCLAQPLAGWKAAGQLNQGPLWPDFQDQVSSSSVRHFRYGLSLSGLTFLSPQT